jgi:hypothetical protein
MNVDITTNKETVGESIYKYKHRMEWK